MKKIRFVEHWTARTGSDHRALFVHVQIRKRRGPWVDLLLVSANMGGRFSRQDLTRLLNLAELLLPGHAVVCLQEAGDQPWVQSDLGWAGFTYLPNSGRPGQASTPTLVGSSVKIQKAAWVQLLDRIYIGRGAGPDHNKPKWWNRNRLMLEGVPFGASSWHAVASQQNRPRLLAAFRQATPFMRVLARAKRPLFVVGDTNSDADQPFSRWLRKRGLTSDHAILGEIPTHGHRSIDAVVCAKRLVVSA